MAHTVSPDKQKKELTAVACLLVTLTLLIVYNVGRVMARRAGRQPAVSVVPQEQPVESSSTPEEANLALLKKQAKELQWGHDPFILSLAKGEELPTLQLQVTGIIHDPIHPEETYAIINDEVVRIGDSLRGIKVVDIQPDSVRFKKFNQEFTLHLYDESKKPEGQGQKTHP